MNIRARSAFRIAIAPVAVSLVSVAMSALGAQAARLLPAEAPGYDSVDWSGWYLGSHFGYSRGNVRAPVAGRDGTGSRTPFGYSVGGLQVGYVAFRSSPLVLGVEADLSFPDFFEDGVISSRTAARGSAVTEKFDFVSTLRGRVGYALDRWLFYGTGGLALSQARFFESPAFGGDSAKVARVHTGWSVGAGAELAIAPNWAARLDYSYNRFAQAGVEFPSGTRVDSWSDTHSLRLGLSRKLGWPASAAQASGTRYAASAEDGRWNIHAQMTFIEQGYFRFRSPYEGMNSLTGASQAKDTESATAFLGLQLWHGAELYYNPEVDQGIGLNTTHGVAAFPNGEAQKASFPMPRFVVDRLFVQQVFGLGGAEESMQDSPNQLAGQRDISRITIIAGRLSVGDYFNGNAYANDPRTNFLNWNTYGAGAFDWSMDQITWTWGALAELNQKDWAFRVGYFLLPIVSSNNAFDTHIPGRGQYTAELEWRYALGPQPGKLRLFGWVNHGTMGGYADALALPVTTPNYPDITLTRQVRTNPGLVISAEQALTDDLGLFSRASWSPGLVEIVGGTDCNRSVSFGGVLKGALWGRPHDNLGIAGVVGGLSPVGRAYFAAGGMGILIGDGALNYHAEQVAEAYYSHAVGKWLTVSLDYQFVVNPGYNADRGPVSIYALRVHTAL